MVRENRLYQTDWLMLFYGFRVNEILDDTHPNLDPEIDPKLSWALRNLHLFPIDINMADYQLILRVPGIGVGSAKKIVAARQFGKLRTYQLQNLGIAYNRAKYFVRCADSPFASKDWQASQIRHFILSSGQNKRQSPQQLTLF
ncbi:helix-hairpin-helix domain-containing protein [Siphonobacter sp.]|uniref:helix-hairpin-helix domain-containing protein n=1 Tax=Siphonobacter sp. TaxID=1869184 RepID=UPI003B3AEF37